MHPTPLIDIGAIVYQRTRVDRSRGMVTGRLIEQGGEMVRVSWSDPRAVSWHYPMELSTVYVPDFKDGQ